MSNLSKSILRIDPEIADLHPYPIPTDWVLEGAPRSRTKKLVTSRDWNCAVVVWDCTPGCFKWHYKKDETILFLSGEAFMIDEKNVEHRFGAGDLAFCPAGTTCTWRVTQRIKKVGIVRETIWPPLGFILKVFNKLFRRETYQLTTNQRLADCFSRGAGVGNEEVS